MAEEKAAKKEIKPYVAPKECPKCGSRMANHSDRYTCGKCGYTEFKSQSSEAQANAEGKPAQEAKKAHKQQGNKEKTAKV